MSLTDERREMLETILLTKLMRRDAVVWRSRIMGWDAGGDQPALSHEEALAVGRLKRVHHQKPDPRFIPGD